ncbi:MAG TPA: DUF4384 domain-containing protein [Gemmatimonadales bacterium]|nr:DUF4384 domain-containing protein [Gemmatimonadales bacterium]
MVLVLLLSLAAPAPSGAAATTVRRDDPPVKVWLDQSSYRRGDKAHVRVQLGEDGYLVVLRADASGRVRALFPLDPGDDVFVRGGEAREIRGRGDREAFAIDEREGAGLVLAVRSVTPFQFDEFVRGNHWDYRVLTKRDAGDDQEQALLDIVQRMVPTGHFDYDAVSYTVALPRAYHDGAYYPHFPSVGLGLGYGFGWPRSFGFSLAFGDPFFFRPFFFRARCFDPLLLDPFFCDPFFIDPFFFPHRFFFFPRVFVFGRALIVLRGRTGVVDGVPVRQGLLIDGVRPGFRSRFIFRDRTPIAATGPRLRVPTGALRSRTTPVNAVGRPREPLDRQAATPTRARPSLERHLPAPRTENQPRRTARAAPAPIWDRRQTTLERRMPGPAARARGRVEGPPAWRAPERLHEPGVSGWGRAPTRRTLALPSRSAGPPRHGGGRTH